MWKYVGFCLQVLLITVTTNIWGLHGNHQRSREQIYLDVLRNITHMNNIVSNLLENYIQLKKDYETKAKLYNVLSTDTESDDIFEKESKHKKKKSKDAIHFQAVTKIIPIDEGLEDDSRVQFNAMETTKEELQQSSVENFKIYKTNQDINMRDHITSDNEEVDTYEDDNPDKYDILLGNIIQKKKRPVKHQFNKLKKKITGTALRNYVENVLLQLEKRGKEDKRKYEKSKQQHFINRYEKPILRNALYEDENIGKDKYYFANNIHKTPFRKIGRHISKVLLILVPTVNNKQKDHVTKKTIQTNNLDEKIRKEQLKTKVLRDAYGDACLKVALRKCYKTLLEVNKIVCQMDFKCKNSFKEQFKSSSKTGCIKEFNYHGNVTENTTNDDTLRYKGRYKLKDFKSDVFKNIGRKSLNINYFNLCLPVMMSDTTNNDNKTTKRIENRDLNKTEPINILRDRYERECKRMSQEKCEAACQYAYTTACSQYLCERMQRKEYGRTCRHECKLAFEIFGDSDSYSDSDDSDSDSDDDDDDSDSESISSWGR